MATIKQKASNIIDQFTSDPVLKAKIHGELSRKQGTEATVKAIVGLFQLDQAIHDKYVEGILKVFAGRDTLQGDAQASSPASAAISHNAKAVQAILVA